MAAAVGVGLVAELLVGSAEVVAERLGWSHVFVSVILLAIIGNAAGVGQSKHLDLLFTPMEVVAAWPCAAAVGD